MEAVDQWTARHACALQSALRMTNEAFASTLGVAVRTVASWHAKPDLIPKTEFQGVLDTMLSRVPADAAARFGRLLREPHNQDEPQATSAAVGPRHMHVAIAIVTTDADVLLVCRRGEDAGGITWQFPAGIVKPTVSPATAAVREVLAETDIRTAVRQKLGGRVHPVTNVYCDYFHCDYLSGTPCNKDLVENVDVTWVSRAEVTRYIPRDSIYPPVMALLDHDRATS